MSTTDQTITPTIAEHPVAERAMPTFPEPVDVPVPAWATRVYG